MSTINAQDSGEGGGRPDKKSIATVIVLGLAIAVAVFLLRNQQPPAAANAERFEATYEAIAGFAAENRRLPSSLEELAPGAGDDRGWVDAWGFPMEYEILEGGREIMLTSLGGDGVKGGHFFKRDQSKVFVVDVPGDGGGDP